MTLLRFPIVCSLLLLLPAATCGSQYHLPSRAQRTTTTAVAVPADTRVLEVQFHDGLLTLEPGTAFACDLQIHLLADDATALDPLAAQVVPTTEATGAGTARLQVALPKGADLESVRTTWRLRAPAGTKVVVITRRGAVVARDAPCDLEVRGGSGVVEAQMAGGSADLTTTSGSAILRGDYPRASVHSDLGRIDLRLPGTTATGTAVRVVSKKGDVYIDLRRAQRFDFAYFGEERLVHCDAEVRVQWSGTYEPFDGLRYLLGSLGDLGAARSGSLRLESQGPVRVRLQPDGALTDPNTTNGTGNQR